MREKDVHKLIEQQDSELKQRILSKVRSQTDVEPVARQKTTAKRITWKWATVCIALVCIVTLSVVLPLTLKGEAVRYCDVTQYVTEDLGQTVKEYSVSHNKNLLYVDWYDIAETVATVYGYNKKDKADIIYITETIVNGETGEQISLSLTDSKTRVDLFNRFYENPLTVIGNVNDTNVRWIVNYDNTLAMFEYQKHTYYLQTDAQNGKESLTAIIENMLK